MVTEMALGALIANILSLVFHLHVDHLLQNRAIHALAQFGVLLLLFEVGLETHPSALARAGKRAFMIAAIGVIMPFILALGLLHALTTTASLTSLFLAASLTATSIAISARTLRDFGWLSSPTGQIVLGAAVFDDVFGIAILGAITTFAASGALSVWGIVALLLRLGVFVFGVALFRKFALPLALRKLPSGAWGAALALAYLAFFAGFAELTGMSAVLGAFAAGLIVEPRRFEANSSPLPRVTPYLVSFFFVWIGANIELSALWSSQSMELASVLLFSAILGKLACGWVVRDEQIDAWLIGFGMIPRGEVGTVFAAAGRELGLFNASEYAAVLLTVWISSVLSPVLLKARVQQIMKKNSESKAR